MEKPTTDFHCPICGAPVKRAIESDQDKSANPTCINEYYVHYASTVAKFTHPRTSPDHVRFAV